MAFPTNRVAGTIGPADFLPPGRTKRHRRALSSWTGRSEEHTSELQSLMRISYAVFCLKKKTKLQVSTRKQSTSIRNTTSNIRPDHTKQARHEKRTTAQA